MRPTRSVQALGRRAIAFGNNDGGQDGRECRLLAGLADWARLVAELSHADDPLSVLPERRAGRQSSLSSQVGCPRSPILSRQRHFHMLVCCFLCRATCTTTALHSSRESSQLGFWLAGGGRWRHHRASTGSAATRH